MDAAPALGAAMTALAREDTTRINREDAPRNHEDVKTPRRPSSHEDAKTRRRPVGDRSRVRAFVARALSAFAVVVLAGSAGHAADYYALVVTGASGAPEYARKYDAWRSSFVSLFRDTFGYPEDRVIVLAEHEEAGARRATGENVRAAFTDLRARTKQDDVVVVLLIGHGTGVDPADAKFNLVGPDLTARDWARLASPLQGRVVFVNTAGGSFPFLEALTGPNRVVVTANDSAAQQFDTILPEILLNALRNGAADTDKDGRVSIWEAFMFASASVRTWYEQQGRLATERPLLDDSGDGIGREADLPPAPSPLRIPGLPPAPGPQREAPRPAPSDGALARTTYVRPDASIAGTADAELTRLLARRREIEREVESLRARKGAMPPAEYEAALEKALLELARLDREIRSRT
jgi:hypothetical protein